MGKYEDTRDGSPETPGKAPNSSSKLALVAVVLVLLILVGARTVHDGCDHQRSNQRHSEGASIRGFRDPHPKTWNPCLAAPADSPPPYPWCDRSLSVDRRARELVKELELEEKAGLFGNDAKGVPRLDLTFYEWWSEALHGVANSPGVNFVDPTPVATSFPQVLTTASALNRTLVRKIASAISTEARAFSNQGRASLTFWTPNINIFRDPRWGRGQETPGEDPLVNGQYAVDFVQSFQRDEADPHHLKNSACCKHFAAYSIENWKGHDRMEFNAVISQRDLQETYLPAFKSCVTEGGVSSLMCSYNAVNGMPSCVNDELMHDLARTEWGFEGYITGDCAAVGNVFERFHFQNHSEAEVVLDVLSANVDIDCGGFLPKHIIEAVQSGVVPEVLVDRALVNLFKVQIRLGMFDSEETQPYRKIGIEAIDTPEHRELALEAARQGMVLLKNADNILPFSKPLGDKNVALIGPHATSEKVMQGNYFGHAPFVISIEKGLRVYASKLLVEQGCPLHNASSHSSFLGSPDGEAGLKAAVKAAKVADQTILALGLDQSQETETHDRESIALPGLQQELLNRVAQAAVDAGKPPIVVIILAGGAIDLSSALGNENVGAILWAGYPGQAGGTAIAETLFGDNNPSGRLTQTFYPESFTSTVPMTDMNMHPNSDTGFPGRTYRFYTGPVVLPFGHGLSYSDFRYDIGLPFWDRDSITYPVTINNTGFWAGADVLMAYLRPPKDAVAAGVHGDLNLKLHKYHRTEILQPGETEVVYISVSPMDHLKVFSNSSRDPTFLHAEYGYWTLELQDSQSSGFQYFQHASSREFMAAASAQIVL